MRNAKRKQRHRTDVEFHYFLMKIEVGNYQLGFEQNDLTIFKYLKKTILILKSPKLNYFLPKFDYDIPTLRQDLMLNNHIWSITTTIDKI